MSTFTATAGMMPEAQPDPTKHVKYNVGMVLGVDDFNQEFAYLLGRDQWMARDLIGYGTVSGLQVSVEDDVVKGPRAKVEPGVALSPRGQLIRVPTAQCAYLNEWLKLDATKKELKIGSPLSALKVYVVLCYRECPTEKVPIPGEPCRSEDDIMLPSRLVDDFRLELALKPPGQREEDAVRDFVEWLRQIEVSDTIPSTPLKEFLDAISSGAHLFASPPHAGAGPLPDYMFGSPAGWFVINRSDLCDYLHAASRLWVTELRPKWRADFFGSACGCSDKKPISTAEVDECLLLAELDLPVSAPGGGADWQVQNASVITKDEKRRPIVVHLRMLQEMLLCGRQEHVLDAITSPPSGGGGMTDLFGDTTGPVTATRVERIQGVAVNPTAPAADQVLTFRAGQWQPAPLPSAAAPISPSTTVVGERILNDSPSNPGAAVEYSRADHTHGTPPDPIPAHRADPAGHNLGGDLAGTVGTATVVGLRKFPINPPAATDAGKVLTFRTNHWTLEAAPAGSPDAVEHPPGLPRYFIVAAGRILCADPAAVPASFPVYNKLALRRVAAGLVSLTFGSYRLPDDKFEYIIKALPESKEPRPGLAVYFSRFLNAGFDLRILDINGPVTEDVLSSIVLHIEVSQFLTS